MASTVLVLNAGSSSIKFSVYGPDQALVLGGMADGIGVTPVLKVNDEKAPASFASHSEALDAILSALADHGYPLARFDAAAHRVVHGGTKITAPARITPGVRDLIEACVPLAPLHNPHNLAAIDTLTERAPDLPQFASFDTAFHA
jgi:acetate kinase